MQARAPSRYSFEVSAEFCPKSWVAPRKFPVGFLTVTVLKGSTNNPASAACLLCIPRWTVANIICAVHVWNMCFPPRLWELHKLHMWNMSSTCKHALNLHAFLVQSNSKSVYFNYLFTRRECKGICVIFNLQNIEGIIYHCADQVVKLYANISFLWILLLHIYYCRIGNSCCKM